MNMNIARAALSRALNAVRRTARRFTIKNIWAKYRLGRFVTPLTALFWLLSALWLVMIFCFSGQTGDDSARVSLSFTEALGRLLPFLFSDTEAAHNIVRKCAHFGVFCVEAIFLSLAVEHSFARGRRTHFYVFAACVLFAALSEVEQMFVEGRGPSFWDVMINISGALIGMLLALAFIYARKRRRARKGEGDLARREAHVFDARAKWLCAAEFHKAAPVNVFHREIHQAPKPAPDMAFANYHMYARRAFRLGARAKSAFLIITADDYYKLYINGVYVAQGPAPGYHSHYYVNQIDVFKYLRAGDNVIALDVYYQGIINRAWVSGDMRQGFMCELRVDGRCHVYSDERFRYMRSQSYETKETFGYDTQFAEHFDSREEPRGWKNTGFDDFMWTACSVKRDTDYVFALQDTPVLDTRLVTPEPLIQDGSIYVYDFGTELAGVLILEAEGRAGDVITVHMGEELSDDNAQVRWLTRANCRYEDTWTLADGRDEWEMYDYRGFRYVEVILPEGARLLSISAREQFYPLDENACSLETSDQALKSVFDLCKNTMRVGIQEGYIDCPTREKGQYSGDLAVTSLSHIYASGDTRLLKKALGDWMRSAFISEGLMGVFPCAYMQEIADYSLLFPMVANRYYEHTGDIAFLREAYRACDALINVYRRYERADGLLENVTEAWNIVDWPANLRDEYDFALNKPVGPGCHNVINALYIGAVGITEQIALVLGVTREARFEALSLAYDETFFRPDTGLYADSATSDHTAVHSCILPLYFGIAKAENEGKIADWLIAQGMRTGVYMAFFYLKALARAGKYDAVYDLITGGGVHSWRNMLSEGATTLFEAWGKDQKWNTSLCHPWASAPIAVLVEDILGITPEVALGAPWKPRLPARVEALRMEVYLRGRRAVFLRDEEATTLTIDTINEEPEKG